jgi:hypothetical protein
MPHKQEHVIDFANTDFKAHIVNNIIKPNYITEIHDSTENRTMWKKRAMRFETCSKLFIGVGSIMSFASGVYGYQTLSFVSGAISTISLVFLQYANFSYKESKKATSDLNILLDNIGIKKVPELNNTTQEDMMMSKQAPPSQGGYTVGGSGYSPEALKKPKKDPLEEYENPLQQDQTEEFKNRLKYEQLCQSDNFEELKKMHEDINYPLTELVLIKSAKAKNLEMFKYFLATGIPRNNWDTLFYIAQSGLDYIKAFFENGEWTFTLKEGETKTPLLGAVISNDIEAVKYMYEKAPLMKVKEIELSEKNKNKEIIEFLNLKKE